MKGQSPDVGELHSLTQGVSQKPPHLRETRECEEQINGWSSPVEGVRKRQPTKLLRKISNAPAAECWSDHLIVTNGRRFCVTILRSRGETFLSIWDTANWTRAPIVAAGGNGIATRSGSNTPDGGTWVVGSSSSYLAGGSSLTSGFSLINTGQRGLLLNREKVTAMTPDLTPPRRNESLIFIQGVVYEITYRVTLQGVLLGSYTTPKASDNDNKLSQTIVASSIATALNGVAGIVAVTRGPVVHVRRTNSAPLNIQIDDERGNTLGRAINDTIVTTSELPTIGQPGFIVKSKNEPGLEIDDRWFKFVPFEDGATGLSDGTWQECASPGVPFRLDAQTMPLVLEYDGVGFVLSPATGATVVGPGGQPVELPSWGERTAGDEELIGEPAFVGKAIKDHLVFRGRYLVCGGNTLMFSEVDDIFNFFADSTVQVQDTDPISLLASGSTATDFQWLLGVDEAVLAFSAEAQYSVRAGGDAEAFSPRSAILLVVSQIPVNPNVRPTLAGSNVAFMTDEYGYTNLREMQSFDSQQRRLGLNLGGSLNANIFTPKYIKGSAIGWSLGENQDFAVIQTDADPYKLYAYKYLWSLSGNGIQKLQSSFSSWTFEHQVLTTFFDGNELYIVGSTTTGVEVLSLGTEELQTDADPDLLLDRQRQYPAANASISSSYDPATDRTSFTLPDPALSRTLVLSRPQGTIGLVVGVAEPGERTIVCDEPGDLRQLALTFGEEYEFRYVFSPVFPQIQDRQLQRVVGSTNGRYQLLTWTTIHHDTGYYQVRVKRPGRPDSVSTYQPTSLAVGGSLLAGVDLTKSGTFRVPVGCRNTECQVSVESRHWLPAVIVGARFEAVHSVRSK